MLATRWLLAATIGAAVLLPQVPPNAPAPSGQPAGKESKVATGQVGELLPPANPKLQRGDQTVAHDTNKSGKTTVYLLVGVKCPASKPYADRLCALEQAYMPKGVDFIYLYPNTDETIEQKVKFHVKECRFTGALWNDVDAAYAKKLGADHTGLAIIADKDGKVLYRGGIDDKLAPLNKVKVKYLARALDEILAGRAVTIATNKDVFGCGVQM
jgi:hypothetical protein